jgi:hypothetical protein
MYERERDDNNESGKIYLKCFFSALRVIIKQKRKRIIKELIRNENFQLIVWLSCLLLGRIYYFGCSILWIIKFGYEICMRQRI